MTVLLSLLVGFYVHTQTILAGCLYNKLLKKIVRGGSFKNMLQCSLF